MIKRKEHDSSRPSHLRWACLALILVATVGIVAAGSRLVQAEGLSAKGSAIRPEPDPHDALDQPSDMSVTLFLPTVLHCIPLDEVTIAGPASGTIGLTQTLTATVSPASSRLPITYTWHVPGQAPIVHSGGLEDVLEIKQQQTGIYTIAVEATNGCGIRQSEHALALTTRGLIAFERHYASEAPHDIWLLDSEGSGMEFNLTNTPDIDEGAPTWSPDGNWLAYSAGAPGSKRAIYKMDLSSGEVISLTDGSRDDRWPAWSPNGNRIVFMRNLPDLPPDEYHPDIYIMDVDGSNQQQLTDWPWSDDFPSWSPDGEWIVFATDRDFAGRDLWKMRPNDPGNLVRLTNTPRPDPEKDERDEIYPSWSPDGWIYHTFVYSNNGHDESEWLYRVRDDGSTREKVFADEYDRYIPSFSPDGNCYVFYSFLGSADKEVWKWCTGFTEAVNLTDNDAGDEFCAWSPVP